MKGLVIYTIPGDHINLLQQRNRIRHSSYKRGYYLSLKGSLVLLQILPGFYRGQTDELNGNMTATTFYASFGTLRVALIAAILHPSPQLWDTILFFIYCFCWGEGSSFQSLHLDRTPHAKQPMRFANF